jgi:hypothetical protein
MIFGRPQEWKTMNLVRKFTFKGFKIKIPKMRRIELQVSRKQL